MRIEPFDAERHHRTAFSCGIEAVDNFLKKTASKLARADNLRLYAMTDPSGAFVGFYAVNAHMIDYTELPAKYARTRPGHGAIPAAYISMIGVDARYQGHGYGGDLLVDALTRIAQAADAIGIAVVILDVLDDGDADQVSRRKALYERYGFQALPSRPPRLFLPLATVRQVISG
jgi:ribosomal protein S18 acetylase RimI-like enzyme